MTYAAVDDLSATMGLAVKADKFKDVAAR